MSTKDFAGLFGGIIRLFVFLGKPLHLISFCAAGWFLYAYYSGQAQQFGLGNGRFVTGAVILATVLSASVIEVLHYFVPPLFFRLLFTVKSWAKSPVTWVMFLALGGLGYGLTKVSAFTSQGGAVDLAQRQYQEPTKVDLSAEIAADSSDRAEAEKLAQMEINAVNLDYDARVKAAAAPFNARIAEYEAALVGHRKDKANGNQWAQSWIEKRNGQIRKAKAERAAAIEAAEAGRDAGIAAVVSRNTSDLRAASSRLMAAKQQAMTQDSVALSLAVSKNANLVALASSGGVNVVWLIVLLSCIVTFYRVFSGHEFEGREFSPSRRLGQLLDEMSGILTDKSDHMVKRMAATRKHLQARDEARPFALPSGRFILLGTSVLTLSFFVTQTFIFTESEYQQAQLVPYPFGHVGAILCVIVTALLIPKKAKARIAQPVEAEDTETGPQDTDGDTELISANTEPKSVPEIDTNRAEPVPEKPETLVPRDVHGYTDNGETDMTAEEIARLRKYARTNYDRIATAATQRGRDSATRNFETARMQLESVGYSITVGPGKKRAMVKRDGGKPKRVVWDELNIV